MNDKAIRELVFAVALSLGIVFAGLAGNAVSAQTPEGELPGQTGQTEPTGAAVPAGQTQVADNDNDGFSWDWLGLLGLLGLAGLRPREETTRVVEHDTRDVNRNR